MLKDIIKKEEERLEESNAKNKLQGIALKILELNMELIKHADIDSVFDNSRKYLISTKQLKKNNKNKIYAEILIDQIKEQIEKIYEIKFDYHVEDIGI